jgi:predicted metal-binding membrane protein
MHTSAIETALRHDRLVVTTGLVAITVSAWLYTLAGVGMPMSTGGEPMTTQAMLSMTMTPAAWSPAYAVLVCLMWWIMMVAMMLPSAAPLVLLFAALQRRKRPSGRPYLATLALVGVATMLQRTRIGKAMRAVSDNRDLAESSGIDVQKVILIIWVIGGGLAGAVHLF